MLGFLVFHWLILAYCQQKALLRKLAFGNRNINLVCPAFPTIFKPCKNNEDFSINTNINTLRAGDADLRFYITTVQDG